MKKSLALVGLLATAVAVAALGFTGSSRSAVFCENVLVAQPDPNSALVGVGETLTASNDGDNCFLYNISTYQWKRDGTAISGATASTYTTTSSDTGHAITVREVDTHGDAQDSINSITVVGSLLLGDDFTGSSGSSPSSTVWNFQSGTGGGITYSGDSTYSKLDGSGNVDVQAVDTGGTWNSSGLIAKTTFTGTRYVEARMKADCYSSTGLNYGVYDYTAGSANNNMEFDLNEQRTGTANYNIHSYNIHHWNAQNEWHSEHWDHEDAGSSVCGQFHTYGEVVNANTVDFYYDGTLQFTENKTDCAFKDPDGDAETYGGNNTGADGDEGCKNPNGTAGVAGDPDSDSDGLPTFSASNYTNTLVARIFANYVSSCPTDESDSGGADSDDNCTVGAGAIGGTGPVNMYIDYIHVYSLS